MAESLSRFSMVFASSRAASHSAASHELCSQGVCRVILIVQYTKSNMGGERKKINRYWTISHSIMQLHITYQDIPSILFLFHLIFLLPDTVEYQRINLVAGLATLQLQFALKPTQKLLWSQQLSGIIWLSELCQQPIHGRRSWTIISSSGLQTLAVEIYFPTWHTQRSPDQDIRLNKDKQSKIEKYQEGIERPWVRPSASCHDVAKLPTLV